MKYALIGCGRIASNHIIAAKATGLELIAVCDVVRSNAEDLLEKHGLKEGSETRIYTDHQNMLDKEKDLLLIAIATESGSHAKIALDCLDASRHVIIEKPIALSISDANEIVRKADLKQLKVSTCHQNRFNPAIQKLREAYEQNRFGKLSHGSIHVRWNRNEDYYSQASWRGTWENDGGCLMNQCIHGIDLLQWMMGSRIVSVYAQTRNRFHENIEAEDVGLAVLTFSDGSIGTIEGTTNVFPKNLEEVLCIFGEKGSVKIGGTAANTIEHWDFSDSFDEDEKMIGFSESVSDVYGNGHTLLYEDIIQAIVNDRDPYIDANAGKDALEVVLAIYKSQKTGLPVYFPMDDFSSTQMIGEF